MNFKLPLSQTVKASRSIISSFNNPIMSEQPSTLKLPPVGAILIEPLQPGAKVKSEEGIKPATVQPGTMKNSTSMGSRPSNLPNESFLIGLKDRKIGQKQTKAECGCGVRDEGNGDAKVTHKSDVSDKDRVLNMENHTGGDDSVNIGLMQSRMAQLSAGYKNKTTVLPQTLLRKNVTEFIRDQSVSDHNENPEHVNKKRKIEHTHTRIKQENTDNAKNELTSMVVSVKEEIPDDIKELVEVKKEAGIDSEESAVNVSVKEESADGNKELVKVKKETGVYSEESEVNSMLNIDVSCCETVKTEETAAAQTDDVCDVSVLFSGELDSRTGRPLRSCRKRGNGAKQTSSLDDGKTGHSHDAGGLAKPAKINKRPNYFIAVQITDFRIRSGIADVQRCLVEGDSRLRAAIINPCSLHITLGLLVINTDEEMHRAKAALDEVSERLYDSFSKQPLILNVAGISHFNNRVVFAQVRQQQQKDQLKTITEAVEYSLFRHEVLVQNTTEYHPHITIAKMSKVKWKGQPKLKAIDGSLYGDRVDTYFGCEHIAFLQLCSMLKPKDSSGYYHVEHAVKLGED